MAAGEKMRTKTRLNRHDLTHSERFIVSPHKEKAEIVRSRSTIGIHSPYLELTFDSLCLVDNLMDEHDCVSCCAIG